jgi:hypothetical protein
MSNTLDQLRVKHPKFTYQKAVWEVRNSSLTMRFFYKSDPELEFVTSWEILGIDPDRINALNPEIIQNWVNQIGMVEALSYWKATCSPEFLIEASFFSAEQIKFWQKLLINGLSEFFYVNQINGWVNNFVQFKVTAPTTTFTLDTLQHQESALIPVGGGKDSAVAMELLKKLAIPISTLTVNKNSQVSSVLAVAGISRNVELRRALDEKILQLNKVGYLNGHTPFSALLAFVSTFTAFLLDEKYVVLSNEQSANEANVTFEDHPVNHQYSKSFEFEQDFRQYLQKNVSQTVEYFSILRPLTELKIAQLFSKQPQYWPVFLSCNVGKKTGKWCGNCPKCLFVFLMLSPFVPAQELEKIWGENLLEKESLLEIYLELSGLKECKSFECVGLREETVASSFLTIQLERYSKLPFILQFAQDNLLNDTSLWKQKTTSLLNTFVEQHFIPEPFLSVLKREVLR